MNMYQEHLMDHYKSPRNYGEHGCDLTFKDTNPLCGDKIVLYVDIKDDIVENVTFTAEGCAISIAAASMMTELTKGKKVSDVLAMKNEALLEQLGGQITTMRLKCALLGLKALQKCLIGDKNDS